MFARFIILILAPLFGGLLSFNVYAVYYSTLWDTNCISDPHVGATPLEACNAAGMNGLAGIGNNCLRPDGEMYYCNASVFGTFSCPGDQILKTDRTCVDVPDCSDYEPGVYVGGGNCVETEPSDPCGNDPARKQITLGIDDIPVGSPDQNICITDLTTRDNQCNDVLGYLKGNRICAEEKEGCEANGGTFGEINGIIACLPENYGDELPTCDVGTVYVYSSEGNDTNGDGYGFSCSSTLDPPNDPDHNPNNDNDTDGDGTPDKNDNDIDGDGTANGSDNDIDGDGIPNSDDPTPYGSAQENNSEVSGGGNCSSRPSCSGDAIQCAILFQNWKTRCAIERDTTSSAQYAVDCSSAPTCSGDAIQCAILKQTWKAGCTQTEEVQDLDLVTDLDGSLSSILDPHVSDTQSLINAEDDITAISANLTSLTDKTLGSLANSSTACTDWEIPVPFAPVTFTINCSFLNRFKTLLAYLFYGWTLVHIFKLATTPARF